MEDRKWWKEAVVYQIYPRSFQDSNGDGIGDLNGIRKRLSYLKELGIDVIWLSPIYGSPNDDNGYDISDYQDIMKEFGTMEDFECMLAEAHALDIKIVMDLVVNHSSDEHKWFVESKKSVDNKYRDYYIWKEPRDGKEPNNWGACFGGSAWEYDETTNMYYLHMFSKKQPDLNWENEGLRKEIYDMMTWWGNKGIDGFRMDVITMISKVQSFPDGKMQENSMYADPGNNVNNGPRVHEFLKEMNREVISKFDWMTVGEGAGANAEDAIKYTGFDSNELNMVFHFEHVNLGQTCYGKWSDGRVDLVELKKVFTKWQDGLEGKAWNSLYWDNHDQPRAVSRFGNDSKEYREISAKMLATCLHFMKGTPYIYQGEELGMTNFVCTSFDQFQDIEIKNAYRDYVETGILSEEQMLSFVNAVGRDNARFPMQWDDTKNAGFTSGTPWILINDNYKEINAISQVGDKKSIFHYYKKLIELRHKMDVIVYGVYQVLDLENKDIFAYTRTLGEESLVIVCNFTDKEVPFQLEDAKKEVLISNYDSLEIKDNTLFLRPYEAKVFR
ncbi:MAG: glycoside hydrolase family 13 protein [Lachnospiraceae bacterium]